MNLCRLGQLSVAKAFVPGREGQSADTKLCAGIGALSNRALRELQAVILGQGTGRYHRSPSSRPKNMNADAIHAALGLAFTAVWLLVGQILVGNR